MMSRIPWRIVVIAFLLIIGISGVIQALPHASETTSDLLIDAAILLAVMGISLLLARMANTRKARKAAKNPSLDSRR